MDLKCDTQISYFVFSFTVGKICEKISYEDLIFRTAMSLRLTERLANNSLTMADYTEDIYNTSHTKSYGI